MLPPPYRTIMEANGTNSSVSGDEGTAELPDADLSDRVLMLFYASCFLLGFPLNLYTLLRVTGWWRGFPGRQIYLVHINLNLTDLMVLTFYCVGHAIWLKTYDWEGGEVMCRLMRFLEALSFTASSNIMVCLAMERVFAVKFPLETRSGMNNRVRNMLILGWTISILETIPQLIFWQLYEVSPTFYQCSTVWGIREYEAAHPEIGNTSWNGTLILSKQTYQIYHLLMTFTVPFIILLCLYGTILTHIRRKFSYRTELNRQEGYPDRRFSLSPVAIRNRNTTMRSSVERRSSLSPFLCNTTRSPDAESLSRTNTAASARPVTPKTSRVTILLAHKFGRTSTNSEAVSETTELRRFGGERKIRRMKLQTQRTTFILIIAYSVFWLPYNVLSWWDILDPKGYKPFENKTHILHGIVVLNSVINPFIYGRFSIRGRRPGSTSGSL